ncbi:MAG: hypothetical protein JSR98_01500, partial [Proteobacteria bacterium]|nr:hypothetical protein [Pseudomonadota bacterium]
SPALARGRPAPADFSGVWTNITATPIERPKGLASPTLDAAGEAAFLKAYWKANAEADADVVGGGESEWWERGAAMLHIDGKARTSMIIAPADGRLPWSPKGRSVLAEGFANNFDDPERRPLNEQCLGGNPSRTPMMPHRSNSLYRFLQTRDHLVIWSESGREPRLIRIGGAHTAARLHNWIGDSVAHWEGRTLVVDTVDFNPREAVRWPYEVVVGPEAHVTERLTRLNATEILYQFTVDDPVDYTQPWSGELIFNATKGPIYEYACHEANYSLPGILAGARRMEAAAGRAASRSAPNGG